ncbi:MAG: tRNA (guanosine(37)-N1)-methyltransferase TrmD [Nitrospirae bacterium RBG_16_64_22]|nr:MAG: tRNA (guanosine(37)-N1)-methyltransferase TrmD [Nitrospirae bacterium RBG_16_64_22]
MKNCHVLTLFPGFFSSPLSETLLKRAREKGALDVSLVDIRGFTEGRHKTADDAPYGGGAGMVLKPEPIFRAVEAVRRSSQAEVRVVLLSPQGKLFSQETAREYAENPKDLVLICGRYEGVDERVAAHLADEELSIGDYVLSGGEAPALVVLEAVARLLPGVLGAEESARQDSFSEHGILDHPHYTRPPEFEGMKVPDVLLSGNHEEIRKWRRREALRKTLAARPDLLARASLTEEDKRILKDLEAESS